MTHDSTAAQLVVLAEKSAKADKSEDALRFSQSACNLANALCAFTSAKKES